MGEFFLKNPVPWLSLQANFLVWRLVCKPGPQTGKEIEPVELEKEIRDALEEYNRSFNSDVV